MKTKRIILSLLLCGAMVFSLCVQPVSAEAGAQTQDKVNDSEADREDDLGRSGQTIGTGGLCEHHSEHTEDCGYSEGTPCSFVCEICNPEDSGETKGAVNVAGVQAMIDALPGTKEVEVMSPDGQREAYDRLQKACDAYEALSGEEQGQIGGAEILEELSRWFNSQTASTAVSGDGGPDGPGWELDDEGTLTITITGTGTTTPQSFSFYKDNIKKVVIGEGITSIGNDAFKDCTSLTEIELPDSLTSIGSNAFDGCRSLVLTELPDNVISIGMQAFRNCEKLALTKLPDSLDTIRSNAFAGCSSLALTELPADVTAIDNGAFMGCTSLALTKLPDSVTSIDFFAFKDCTSLALTELPAGVTSIEMYAFDGCSSLALTKLPDSVTSIGNYAFNGCGSLALTELPAGVTSIGNSAFYNCSSLALTKLPDSLTSIENYAFSYCSSLALTELPAGLTSIAESVFSGCTGLKLTELPAGLTSIGRHAFNGCTSLALTKLPDSVTSIGDNAFYRCASLALTELPAGVTSIENYTFYGCSSLAMLELPDSVTSIGNNAFRFCTGLTGLLFTGNTAPTLGSDVFTGCTALDTIYILAGSIGYTAQNNWPEDKIKILTVPSFVIQPQDEDVTVGQVATFSVEVSDGPVPAYQWQVSKDGSNWEDIPGATDGSYTTEATDKGMDGWKYQCVAANKAGSITSDTAILTVKSTDVSLQSVSVDGTEGTIVGTMITVVLPYGKILPTESGKVNITPAAGATVSALAMTDSGATWTFTVTAEDGTTTADYTIKVSNAPNPAAGNIADVAAAKSMIEKYNWIAGQSDANTEAELKAWIENQINGMNLNGVDYTVSITGFTAGINGSEANKNGTDGSFSFTISLSKGAGNTFAIDMVTGVTGIIAAMPYQAGEYMVSVSASPAAGGTVSGGGRYTENTSVTVTATAQGDYHFVKWTEGGREVSGSANYTFVVDGNRTLVAFFERDGDPTPPQQARYSVTVNGSYAAESGAGSYEAGATVFIHAGSRSNYRFDGWTSSDGIDFANAENASTTFIMPDKAVAVTANWTYTKDGSGGGSSDPENNTDGGTGGSFTGVKNPQTGDNGAADAGNSANSEDMAGVSYLQKPAANAAGPQTGSDDSISLWETTGLCALLVGAAAVIYKRRRKTKAGT